MPLESPSVYNIYLFNHRIANHILIKISVFKVIVMSKVLPKYQSQVYSLDISNVSKTRKENTFLQLVNGSSSAEHAGASSHSGSNESL